MLSSTPRTWARYQRKAKRAKGASHAVLCGRRHVGDEPFALLLGDDLIDERDELLTTMMVVQGKTGASVVAQIEVESSQISTYGCMGIFVKRENSTFA
ncbi:hypothetical protein ARUE_c33190 [Arthrobacter sp. Rue61a]|nr:hypothetical protein ARUE_c33190 [Arthrobacter sp. Rue61a]